MPVGYWLFVGLTLVLVSLVGYGVYATNRLLRTWQPDRNLLLLPGENVVRLVLVLFCLLLGAASGLSCTQLGWSLQAWSTQTWIGLGWGCGLAIFFYLATQWMIRNGGQRFYSAVVIKAIVPQSRRELYLVLLAMAPVVLLEELLFRSLLLGGLAPILPAPVLMVASALLFGWLHVPQGVWGVAGATLAGLLFGWLFITQGSLLAPLVAHYVANAVQIIQAMRQRDHVMQLR